MKNNGQIVAYSLITILFSILIFFKLPYSNFIPVIYLIIFYPFFILKWLKLINVFSIYLKNKHIDFYNKNKSLTYSFGDANMVFNFDENEIKKLNDPLAVEYAQEIKRIRKLMYFCFFGFIILVIILIENK
ncbi:hypothetical protein [Flavobacterium wongokense]|uniref:hypothetical protein n=1 Tax=Flavobacterium wongokense TaxID=2910674 RepID=UPI001F399361|nr:hypothetical protein [Flavobacterium sp. WG47]MCF6133557.1 hypothetical protein [Flavobacterium sp. WG47]